MTAAGIRIWGVSILAAIAGSCGAPARGPAPAASPGGVELRKSALTTEVAIAVVDGWGAPVAGQLVEAIDADDNVVSSGATDAAGHLSLAVDDDGTFVFRTTYHFADFESAACNVSGGCSSATVQIEKPVAVEVTDGYGGAVTDQAVTAIDDEGNEIAWGTTDATGVATFYLSPPGPYFFRAVAGNAYFDSAPDCGIPGCVSVSLAVTRVLVTVTGTDGRSAVGVTVAAVDTDGVEINWVGTDAQGRAAIGVPAGAFKFRVHANNEYYESGSNGHCLVGAGCTTASISVPICTGVPDGTTCSDGGSCTQSETCQAGSCQAPNQPTILNLPVADLGDLGGHYAIAEDVNASGQAVGGGHDAAGQSHAFLSNPGSAMVDLGNQLGLPAPSSANAISDKGTIVGSMTTSGGVHAYRYSVAGGFEDLGLGGDGSTASDLGGLVTYQGSYGAAVNGQGQVAGRFTSGGVLHGFRYTDGIGFEDIGSLAGGMTLGWAIDDSGTVGGSSWVPGTPDTFDVQRFGHAVIFDNAVVGLVDLNDLIDPTLGWTLHAATDTAGDFAIGTGTRNGKLEAFRLRLSTGVIEEIANGWEGRSFASGVTSQGDVVGWGYRDLAEADQQAFVYSDRFGFKKLNDIIDPASGWDLRVTSGIGEAGDIVGWGYKGGNVSAYRLRLPAGGAVACEARNFCGGSGDQICLFSDGVVETSPGHFVAVFGFDNGAVTSVQPTVNQVRLDGNLVANPQPAPPMSLLPGTHSGAFLPAFDAGQSTSWTVNGETVSASASSPRLQAVDLAGGHLGVLIDGQTIDLAQSPADAVTPRVDGICAVGMGQYVAVFGYDNVAPENVKIGGGTPDNLFAINGVATPTVSPAPPTWFKPGTHLGTFLPSFSSAQTVSWTVAGQTVTASSTSTILPCGPPAAGSTGLVATVGSTSVVIRRDVAAELAGAVIKPDLVTAGSTVGTLDGHLDVSPDGAATYHVPIWLPEAPLQPQISLDYNSRNGDSVSGVGFRLTGFSEITRCRAAYAQDPPLRPENSVNFAATDHLCLDGRILVSTSGTPWTDLAEFRPDNDPFTRVRQHVVGTAIDASTYFEVFRRDGTIETYGKTPQSIISGGLGIDGVYSWAIDKRSDRSGNVITYDYLTVSSTSLTLEPGALNERVPRGIFFGGVDGGALPYEVFFAHDPTEPRPSYIGGYKMDSTWLLTAIEVYGPAPPVNRAMVRHYAISYDSPTITHRKLISAIQECDGVGPTAVCKPSTTFAWEPGSLTFHDVPQDMGTEIAPTVAPAPRSAGDIQDTVDGRYYYLATGDVNGDGRDDLVYRALCPGTQNICLFYRLSTGEAFGPSQMIPGGGGGISPTYQKPSIMFKEVLIADVDLDGAADVKMPGAGFHRIGANDTVGGGDAVADLDGDGLPDYIEAFVAWDLYAVTGQGNIASNQLFGAYNRRSYFDPLLAFGEIYPAGLGFDQATLSYGPIDYKSPFFGVVDERHEVYFPPLVDLNGDGAVDLVLDAGNAVSLVGRNAAPHYSFPPTGLPTPGVSMQFGDLVPIFGDFNGDGLPDSLGFTPRGTGSSPVPTRTLRINTGFRSSAGGFQATTLPPETTSALLPVTWLRYISSRDCFHYLPPNVAQGCPSPFDEMARVEAPADPGLRVADFNGDGRQDILSFAAGGASVNGVYDPFTSDFTTGLGSYDGTPVVIIPGAADGLGVPIPVGGVGSGGNKHKFQPPHAFNRILDVNGDGLPDFITNRDRGNDTVPELHLYVHEGKEPDLLRSVTNGLGSTDSVDYDHLGNIESGIYSRNPPGTCVYPQTCINRGVWVVSKVHRDTGGMLEPQTADYTYQYRDARADVQGLGWLGFAGVTITNQVTGEIVDVTYGDAFVRMSTNGGSLSNSYPEASLPTKELQTWSLDASHALRRSREYKYTVLAGGAVVLASSIEEEQEGEGAPLSFMTKTRRTILRPDYDEFGNPLHETDQIQQRDSRASDLRDVFLATVDRTYDNDQSNWLLGLKRTERTELQTFGEDAEDVVRGVKWDYFPGTTLVTHAVREPGKPGDLPLLTTFGRNSRGLVTRIERQDSSGQIRATDISYDPVVGHFPETVTEAGLTVTQRRHPTLEVLFRAEDPNGAGASFIHDTFGRTKQVIPDLAGATTLTYLPVFNGVGGFAIDSVTGGSPQQRTTFDRLGRLRISLVQSLDVGTFSAIFTDYDAAGRIARVSRPTDPAIFAPTEPWIFTNFGYDAASRLTSMVYPAEGFDGAVPKLSGQVVRAYDWLSATDFHFDKVGDATPRLIQTTTIDARGDIVSTSNTDPETARVVTTSFVYGPTDSLKKVTDAAGNVTSMVHDAWGRRTRLVDPDIGTTDTTYNAFDDAVADTTARGTTLHTVDDLGRLINDQGPDGITTFAWDVAANGLGKPGHATSPDGIQTSWAYDTASREQATKWTIPGEPAPLTIVRNRDSLGRLQSVVYPPSGSYNLTAVYGYAPTGYLQSITRQEGAFSAPLWRVDSRVLDGQIEQETFGDGPEVAQTQSTRSYSFTGKLLTQSTVRFAEEGSLLRAATYDYDGLGRLINRSGDTFEYDFLNRLHRWNHGSSAWTETYDYDDIGNLRERAGASPNGVELSETWTPGGVAGAGPHAVATGPDGAYSYDELGNQKAAPGRTAQFWQFGLPQQITSNGLTTTFKYDALRGRILKSNNQGSSTTSVGGLYEKRVSSGQTTYAYYVAGERGVVAQVEIDALGSRHVKGLHDDHLGSTVLVTDENGLSSTIDFDPWGQKVTFDANNRPVGVNMSVPGLRVGFTGHDEDDDLGLVNMLGRLYDGKQRRFISPDPFVSDPFNGQSHNRYAYVLNNPLNLIDPTGFEGEGGGQSVEITATQVSGPPGGTPPSVVAQVPQSESPKPGTGRPTSTTHGPSTGGTTSVDSISIGASAGGAVGIGAKAQNVWRLSDGTPCIGSQCYSGGAAYWAGSSHASGKLMGESGFRPNLEFARVAAITGQALAVAFAAIPAISAGWASFATWAAGNPGTIAAGTEAITAVGEALGGAPGATAAGIGAVTVGIRSATTRTLAGACFARGTLIVAANGLVPIQDVEIGDLVLSRDPETGRQEYKRVVRRFVTPDQPVLAIKVINSQAEESTFEATLKHPFWVVERGWVAASLLASGDRLETKNGEPLKVLGLSTTRDRVTVYNLEVEAFRTYFVGADGAWVHNQSAAPTSSRVLLRTLSQLASKFKHAADFGVVGNYNKANAAAFSRAINQHINSAAVLTIQGTYRGNPVTHYLNPSSGLNVIADPSGAFVSGWRLTPAQLQNVLTRGSL